VISRMDVGFMGGGLSRGLIIFVLCLEYMTILGKIYLK